MSNKIYISAGWRRNQSIFLYVLGCLAVAAKAHALVAQGPYARILESNVFRLVPPKVVTEIINAPPLAKIIPSGIITLIGKRALFRVQWLARAGEPAREESYILAEGERAGEIEVLAIDENAGTIRFSNRGTIVLLALEKDGIKPPRLDGLNPKIVPISSPLRVQPPTSAVQLSPEEQIIMMEIEREGSKAAIQKGQLPPLPPTPLTPR